MQIFLNFTAMISAAIFASGEGTNAENLVKYFSGDKRIKIKIIITNKDDAGVIRRMEKYKKNIHIISKDALNNYTGKIIEFLREEQVGLIILAGFLLKIPAELIQAFPGKIINLHPSLLPKFGGKGMYGMKVHEAVINAGEKESGITIHLVSEEYDNGKILMQEKCSIEKNETPQSLSEKVRKLELNYFPKAVEMILG